MQDDDQPVGKILSRREILALFGAASTVVIFGCEGDATTTPVSSTPPPSSSPTVIATGAASVTATATGPEPTASSSPVVSTTTTVPACVVRPELTEGPYFVDEMLNRSDIRSDPSSGALSDGVPLVLTFRVSRLSEAQCSPLEGAQVDVWHCDGLGVYSDVSERGFDTTGQKFLRGYQATDPNGQAAFTTIYPGWYEGRTVHIHFKVRNEGAEFTSQLFFDDELSDEVFGAAPYAGKGERGTRNENDNIFGESGGVLTLVCEPASEGYTAVFDIALQA